MSRWSDRLTRSGAGVALLALVWLAVLAWPRPLMLPDEGRYVGVAWGMVQSGDWLLPTLDGLPYFHKPPLFYWLTSAAMTVLGANAWAARTAAILGAWAGAMAVFLFLRRWWGEPTARLALVALLTQPLFYIGGQFANLDMLVAGCITVTVTLLAHAALLAEAQQPRRLPLLGAYAAAALGVLAKGLIGAVLPALVIGAWLLVRGRWRTLLSLLSVPGSLLFLVMAAPWFIAMNGRFDGFLHYFFVVQHFQRFASGSFNNVQPVWFFPALLLVCTLPWLVWLRPAWSRSRLGDAQRGPVRQLMWLWLALVVGFFSIPASKLVGYVLPAVPPLAVLLADGVEGWRERSPGMARHWRLSAGIGAALSLAAVAVLALFPSQSTRDLGQAVRAQRTPGEPVFMLDRYWLDLPFYARIEAPAAVVLDWTDPGIRAGDSRRRELADAGDFAPARARDLLLMPGALAPALCAHPVSWVIGPPDAGGRYRFLAESQLHLPGKNASAWRIDREQARLTGALNCPGTPSGVGAARS